MEGISLGSAFLRLYGDRSALDQELERLKRQTDQLERNGINVPVNADTRDATRELTGLRGRLQQLQDTLNQIGQGLRGDGDAWSSLADSLSGLAGRAAESGGAMGRMGSMLGNAGAAAARAIPILGQLGMAAMGVQAVFQGLSGAINGVIGPLAALSQEAGRFNQQVAEASIFATNAFAVIGPDGKAIEGTANQMRALRGTISKEYKEIQKEVAQISGATASQIYDGFNIILQNVSALGSEGEDLSNVRKLATRLAAGMNTLNVPGDQLTSEMYSLLSGDVQMYDKLGRDLYGPNASQIIKKLQAEDKFYEDLMGKLEKLYDGQKVLSESLVNVQSNFSDVFETISSEGGQALERGLAKSLKAVLNPLDELQGSFMGFMRAANEFLEPIMRILGEIGGWFVSVGSAIASTLQVVMDLLALGASVIGSVLGPALRGVGKALTAAAKGFELIASLVSAVVRPITTLFRILGDQGNQDVDGAFDPIIEGLDSLIGFAERASQVIARPFIEYAKWRAWARGKSAGKSDEQIKGEQDEIETEFAKALGQSDAPTLRALKLGRETEDLLNEINQRLGSGSTRQLNIAKETSQLVQDRIKNEITGLEQGVKLLQTQKGLQESMNQLAEARRGIAMSRAGFAVQVAGSPEARLAAEERKNELAARQEQERINERKALLGTERQLLQLQLQMQVRQQQIQQEQLKIQRLEIQIQRDKAMGAAKDVANKLNNAAPGSSEYRALREQWKILGDEYELRRKQLAIMDRTVALSFEAEAGARRTNAIEQQRLGIQGQVLDVQGQAAGLTLQQQQTLTRLQRQEQELKNQLTAQQNARNNLIKAAEQELQALQRQEKTQQGIQEIERARMESRKAAADAEVQTAERELRAVQARDGASTGRDYLAAQIEAIAAGTKGFVSEADATRRLYDAKGRQLALEQEMQRQQLQAQQERERSELRIAAIQLRITELQTLNLQTELQFRRQQLGLQQQRDALAGSSTIPGAPPAPVLPPPAGGSGAGSRGFGTLSVGAIKGLARAAGFNDRDASIMAAIAMAESGGRSSALNNNPGTGDLSFGLWQVNMIGRMGPERRRQFGISSNEALFNPEVNAAAARQVKASQGFAAWSVYRSGAYKAYLPAALQAQAIDPGASIGATGQAPTSLGNDLLQNSTDLVRVEGDLARIRGEQVQLQTQEAQLSERLALGLGALETNQAAQRAQFQTDQLRAQLTAEVLNSFKGRLAVGVADAFATGMTGAVRGVFAAIRSGQSVGDAINGAMERMADQVLETILSAALKPMQDAIYENILGGLLGNDLKAVEQQVAAQQQAAAQGLTSAGQVLQTAGQGLQAAAQAISSAASGATGAAGAGAAASGAAGSSNSGGLTWPAIPDFPETEGSAGPSPNGPDPAKEQAKQAKQAKSTAEKSQELQKAMGAATMAFAGVALAMNGIEQLGKGGTYNTLMGLASVFGAIGSIAGAFGSFASTKKRATGGPVSARMPYLVGEQGPELFVPGASGQILNADRSQRLFNQTREAAGATAFASTRNAVAQQQAAARENDAGRALADALLAPADPLKVAFETTRINSVDYVTADQFRAGMTQSAERGRALTLAALKNSVKTRRMVGV